MNTARSVLGLRSSCSALFTVRPVLVQSSTRRASSEMASVGRPGAPTGFRPHVGLPTALEQLGRPLVLPLHASLVDHRVGDRRVGDRCCRGDEGHGRLRRRRTGDDVHRHHRPAGIRRRRDVGTDNRDHVRRCAADPGDPRESVPSALDDMEDEAFPAPLVEPAEIRSAGPPPDEIPPIDAPRFQEASTVDWLEDVEAVLLVEVYGEARAYPVQVMTWHEIVNDTFGDAPITVSYCPLCNSAITYVRTGQAVVGALTGSTLETLPVTMVSWATFRETHPDALVLSKDTGFDRQYGLNPYPGYDDVNQVPLMFKGYHDSRLLGRRSRTRRRHGRRASTKRDFHHAPVNALPAQKWRRGTRRHRSSTARPPTADATVEPPMREPAPSTIGGLDRSRPPTSAVTDETLRHGPRKPMPASAGGFGHRAHPSTVEGRLEDLEPSIEQRRIEVLGFV